MSLNLDAKSVIAGAAVAYVGAKVLGGSKKSSGSSLNGPAKRKASGTKTKKSGTTKAKKSGTTKSKAKKK